MEHEDKKMVAAYKESSFWRKAGTLAVKAGQKAVYAALLLYYTLQDNTVPKKAKAAIMGALGYLIFPVDVLPDFLPLIGYTDDIGVMIAAISAVAVHLNDSIRQQAMDKMQEWFAHTDPKQVSEIDEQWRQP